MIDKKKKKKIKYLNLIKYINFSIFKDQINKILDTTFIEDDQIRFLKAKLLKGQISLNNFLKKTVISPSQLKELDKYLAFFDRKKINSKNIFYFSKIKEKCINYKKSAPLANFKSIKRIKKINKFINFSKIKESSNKKTNKFFLNKFYPNYKILKKIEKFKYQKYFNERFNKKLIGINELTKIQFNNKKLLETFQEKISNYKLFSNLLKGNSIQLTDEPEYIAALYYSDHYLFIAKIWKSSENILNVEKVIELPVPASVIGDDVITNIDELIELSLDSFEVLDLKNPPILVVLSSSFFSIKSFKIDNENQISENNEIIQSKSPYLPQDTIVDIQKVNDTIFNAIYTRKSLINSWINTLKKVNYPVIGITTPGPHQIDFLRENKKIINNLEIIIDIELNSSTLFICKKDYELSSQKIPYGSALYGKKELVESYFSRLIKSIKLLTDDFKVDFPETIYVTGFGLDDFDYESQKLPYPFVRFSELNKTNFKFIKANSNDLLTGEINSKLNTVLGITSKCL